VKCLNRILLFLLLPLAGLSAADQAEEIMRRHYDLAQPDSVRAEMIMVLKDKTGRISKKVLAVYSRTDAARTWSYTEVLSPADVRGTRFLSVPDENGGQEQRLWLPELGRIRKISTGSEQGRFLGSDLSYWDMKTHRFEDFSYTLLGEESVTCIRNGVKERIDCWILESRPKKRSCPYGRIVAHIGKQDFYAYRSQMWGTDGAPVKTIIIAELTRQDGATFPTQTLVIASDGHKTLLKVQDLALNATVGDRYFSLQYLSR